MGDASPYLKAALASVMPGYRRLLTVQMETEAANLRLASITPPARISAVVAEVERRWEVHQDFARTAPCARNLGKAAVIDSVYRDVATGLL